MWKKGYLTGGKGWRHNYFCGSATAHRTNYAPKIPPESLLIIWPLLQLKRIQKRSVYKLQGYKRITIIVDWSKTKQKFNPKMIPKAPGAVRLLHKKERKKIFFDSDCKVQPNHSVYPQPFPGHFETPGLPTPVSSPDWTGKDGMG